MPGVEAAEGSLETGGDDLRQGRRARRRQRAADRSSSPRSGERFDPLTYVEGGPAEEPGEVTLDKATADKGGFEVGDQVLDRRAGRPREPYELVGIAQVRRPELARHRLR